VNSKRGSLPVSDQTEHQGSHDRLNAGPGTQFHEYAFGVRLDRFRCYPQIPCDTLVGVSSAYKLQNEMLTRAETHWVQPRRIAERIGDLHAQ